VNAPVLAFNPNRPHATRAQRREKFPPDLPPEWHTLSEQLRTLAANDREAVSLIALVVNNFYRRLQAQSEK
jgi:hypothetical protein